MIDSGRLDAKRSALTEADRKRLAAIRHLALDMDGTLYLGGTLFEFTDGFLRSLRAMNIGYTFFTNNSSRSTKQYIQRLSRMGIDANPEMFYSSTHATIDYLHDELPAVKRLFVLGTPGLQQEIADAGFELSDDNPDAVVIGYDTGLTYERLTIAATWIKRGKPYIATHPDLVCPTDQQVVLPDCGSICQMLTAATDRLPDVVLGKPHVCMLAGLMHRHGLKPEQVAVLGDRLYTDVAMANNVGALSVLVLTGETRACDVERSTHRPMVVVEHAGKFAALLQSVSELSRS